MGVNALGAGLPGEEVSYDAALVSAEIKRLARQIAAFLKRERIGRGV